MKKLLFTSFLAIAGSVTASATSVTFNCNPFPATFNNGAGNASVVCPSLNNGGATGATTLNGVSLTYYASYQFGTNTTPNSNSISVVFTPDTQSGALAWNLPATTVTNTNGQSTAITNGTGSLTSGINLANFANSNFNVGVSSSVTAGGVATSSGAISVTYDYSVAQTGGSTPEPATVSLIGLSMVGLGFAAKKRKA